MTLTLRKKTLIIVTGTLVALIVILYFAISQIVLGSFEELENDDVSRHVQRVTEALDRELVQMSINAQDNALPGSSAERMGGLFDEYGSTVTPSGQSGRVDLLVNRMGGANVLVLTNTSGEIIWGWGYDEEKEELTLVPDSLKEQLSPGSPLLEHPGGEGSFRGIALLPEGPMLAVSEYFPSSEGKGRFFESILVGKYLDDVEVQRLGELTRLNVAVRRLDSELPPDFQAARSALSDEIDIHVDPLSDDFVAGYTLRADIHGEPGLLWQVTVPRDIIDEGNKSINFLLIALVVVGVVLVVVIAFLLDKLVLSRMASLNGQVSSINIHSELSQRVSMPGNDELSTLSGAINGMLGEIQTERGKSEALLLNVLPGAIAERLKEGESVIADSFSEVSVLFSDVVGFTKLSARISPTALVDMLNRVFSAFDRLTDECGLEKIKTIGDAYMVVGGLPTPRPDHAEAIATMALGMQQEVARLNGEHGTSLILRIGINSGPVVAGVIGTRKFIYDLWGDTVNTAARMESHGVEGSIQVTAETYNLLRDKYLFEDRGIIDVKGKGEMHTYLLVGSKVPSVQGPPLMGAEVEG